MCSALVGVAAKTVELQLAVLISCFSLRSFSLPWIEEPVDQLLNLMQVVQEHLVEYQL